MNDKTITAVMGCINELGDITERACEALNGMAAILFAKGVLSLDDLETIKGEFIADDVRKTLTELKKLYNAEYN